MKRVLIVDDEVDISELISLILKKEGIDSKIINNPLEVPELVKKEKFDLILLDIMMPELSGTELCSKIRDVVDAPIIFISAKSELIDKMLGYEIGGDDYITKPFDNTELLLKVKELEGLLENRDAIISELTEKLKEAEAKLHQSVEDFSKTTSKKKTIYDFK